MPRLPALILRSKRDLLTLWVMALAAGLTALAINQFRDKSLPFVYLPKAERIQQAVSRLATMPGTTAASVAAPSSGVVSNLPATSSEVRYLDLAGFRAIVEQKTKGIILDARPEIFHRLGHVPGALSLPREVFETAYAKRRSLLAADQSQLIAVYCSGISCEDSQMVAEALVKLGYSRIFVFKGGWSEWTANNLPEEKAP